MKTYITYFDDRQIEEYNLKSSEDIILFKGNDSTIKGENINYLNTFYCELCTLYWVWKNTDDELLCFKQYRRPFDSQKRPNEGEIVTYEPYGTRIGIKDQYGACHSKKRANDVLDVLKDTFGEKSKEVYYWTLGNLIYTNNTMIINRKDFNEMCEFLFDILFKLDKKWGLNFDVDKYVQNGLEYTEDGRTDYQQHFMAYIGERLVSMYIFCRMKPIHESRSAISQNFFAPYQPKTNNIAKYNIGVIVHTNYSLDSDYIEEFCEYYLQTLKVDKIVLVDDYHKQEHYLNEIKYIKEHIESEDIIYKVITNHPNQHALIPALYNMFKDTFNWIYMVDSDEFLNVQDFGYETLADYIKALPSDAEVVQFPWRIYTDNGQLLKVEGKVQERFPIPSADTEKIECKVMVKGGLNNTSFFLGHIAVNKPNLRYWNSDISNCHVYYSDFTPVNTFNPFHNTNHYNSPYIKHYYCKSTEEYIKRKIQGRMDLPTATGKETLVTCREVYFRYNKRTPEKEEMFNKYLNS